MIMGIKSHPQEGPPPNATFPPRVKISRAGSHVLTWQLQSLNELRWTKSLEKSMTPTATGVPLDLRQPLTPPKLLQLPQYQTQVPRTLGHLLPLSLKLNFCCHWRVPRIKL